MRNLSRIKPFCDTLATIWGLIPDWRLSQLMVNAINDYTKKYGHDPFYMEDQDFLMYLFNYVNEVIEE